MKNESTRSCWSASWTVLCIAVCLEVSIHADRASAGGVTAAWDYVASDLETTFGHRASCSSADGRLAIVARTTSSPSEMFTALILSPRGEPTRRALSDLPEELGAVRQPHVCLWTQDGHLIVLVTTSTVPLAALWLSPSVSFSAWLALERTHPDTHPLAIAELEPARFVAVGFSESSALAILFDRQSAKRLALPWLEDRRRVLADVAALEGGGFSVCGTEGALRGAAASASTEVVVATFEGPDARAVETRLPGSVCRLLSSRPGKVRILHDDGMSPRHTLLLTTLGDGLKSLGSEALVSPFAFELGVPSFEIDGRVFVVNRSFAWETLEIRGPAARESVDLNVMPGGVLDLLPGPSRVFLVSTTRAEDGSTERPRFGVRVDAFDVAPSKP